MRRARVLTLITCVTVALAVGPALAGVTIFLSEETTAGSVVVEEPVIDTTAAIAGGTLGVWVIPGTGDESVLNGISLDLGSDAVEFDFLGTSAVLNPTVTGGSRWFDDAVDGFNIETITDQALTNIIGLALDAGQGGITGQGLGTGGGTSIFDAGTGAYLYATIDYNAEMDATGALTLSEGASGIIDSLDALVTGNTITGATFSPGADFWEADFDENLFVDGGDFGIWQTGFGTVGTATKGDGDANADMNVDGADFGIWQTQFGNTGFKPGVALATAVPEPSALLLALAGVLALMCRRKTN